MVQLYYFFTLITILSTFVSATSCDRKCLLQLLTIYTDAISLGNTSAIPVAPNVRITNNGNVTTLGDGIVWHTPGTIRIPYRHTLVDTETGAAVLRATITNQTLAFNSTADQLAHPPLDQWWWYTLRLKVVDCQITEIEEIASDTPFEYIPASILTLPDRVWSQYIPQEQQSTREELLAIVDSYFNTLSGTILWQNAPFHPECNRFELGAQTTNALYAPGSCGTEFTSPVLQGGTVANRRFYVADPTFGVVGAVGWFGPQVGDTGATIVFEEFKIQDGLIRHIEAFFDTKGQLYSGWGNGRGSGNP
jgi:hypothetical protein